MSREIREVIKGREKIHSLSILYFPWNNLPLNRNVLIQGIEVEKYFIEPFKREVCNVLYFNSSILIRENEERKYLIRIES